MNRILESLTFLAAAAFALPATAVTWTTNSDTVTYIDSNTYSVSNTYGTIKYHAYSNSAWMPSDSPGTGIGPIGQNLSGSGTVGGNWIAAGLAYYGTGSGFGVKNVNQQGAGEEDISPEHATDNKEVLDFLVIELPSLPVGTVWDLESFKLGWAQEGGAGTSTDISMFIGGKNLGANYDFAANNVCMDFSGGTCTGMNKLSTLGGGFTNITSAIANSGNNLVQDTSIGVTTAATGNYLIVSGRLGEKDDAFKFKAITATSKVPEPGTLALLGLGLFGLAARRRAKAA